MITSLLHLPWTAHELKWLSIFLFCLLIIALVLMLVQHLESCMLENTAEWYRDQYHRLLAREYADHLNHVGLNAAPPPVPVFSSKVRPLHHDVGAARFVAQLNHLDHQDPL